MVCSHGRGSDGPFLAQYLSEDLRDPLRDPSNWPTSFQTEPKSPSRLGMRHPLKVYMLCMLGAWSMELT